MLSGKRIRPVDGLIITHGLSSFCLGLVFPYTAIYLSGKPGIGTAGVALFYACTGTANLVVALLLSTGLIKVGRVPLGVLGTLLWFVGYLLLPMVDNYPGLVAAAVCIGTGQAAFLAAIIPIVNSLVTAEERRAVFARRYMVLNGTLALGSLTGGLLITVLPSSVIPTYFLVNAVGMLPVGIAMLMVRRHVRAHAEESAQADHGAPMPVLRLWKVALPAALFQLAVYLFGFSQLEATAPLVSVNLMGLGLSAVSLLLVVNVIVIVGAQRFVTRLLQARSEVFGLCLGAALWVLAYVVVGLPASAPHGWQLAGLLGFAVLFGLGECAYSCSFHPWLISMVPDHELARANALANSMMGIGNFMGPSIGIGLALSGNATVVWLGLGASCGFVTVAMGVLAAKRTAKLALAAQA